MNIYPDPEKLFAWARYLYWSDLLFRRYNEAGQGFTPETQEGVPTNWADWWHYFALMSQWYASEYVVVEGWAELKASDPVIDQILADHPGYLKKLKRYRNAVFHYRPSLSEQRFLEFLQDAMRTVPWMHHLHAEFLRYYWEFVEDLPGMSSEQRNEMHNSALTAVGWVPSDIFPARLRAAEFLAEKANFLTAGDENSEALDLRSSAEHLLRLARHAAMNYGPNLSFLYKEDQ